MFLDYKNQLDLRIAKNFRFGSRRVQGFADVFNVLNAGTVLRVNETYAATGTNAWLTPTDYHGRPLPALRNTNELLIRNEATAGTETQTFRCNSRKRPGFRNCSMPRPRGLIA